jgi:hypothetical protein
VKLSWSQRKYRNQSHEFQASHSVSPIPEPGGACGAHIMMSRPRTFHCSYADFICLAYLENTSKTRRFQTSLEVVFGISVSSGYLHKMANGSNEQIVSEDTEVSMMSLL